MKPARGTESTREAAVERAAPDPAEPRVTLTRDEKALLEEALEQCRNAADEMQDQLGPMGGWGA